MFAPDWDDGCPSCSARAEEMSAGLLAHPHSRGTTLVYVSRARLSTIETYKARKGWTFPWYSSHGSDFNYDDLTALGRQEDWEEPKGRAAAARAAVPDFSS